MKSDVFFTPALEMAVEYCLTAAQHDKLYCLSRLKSTKYQPAHVLTKQPLVLLSALLQYTWFNHKNMEAA